MEAGRLQFHRNERGRRDAHGLVDGGMRRRDAPFLRELGDTRRGVLADRSPGHDDISRWIWQNRRVATDARDERGPARSLVGRYHGHGQRAGDPGGARFRDARALSEFQIPEWDFRGQILAERRLGQGLLHAEHKGRRPAVLRRPARDGPAVHAVQSALHELPGGANVEPFGRRHHRPKFQLSGLRPGAAFVFPQQKRLGRAGIFTGLGSRRPATQCAFRRRDRGRLLRRPAKRRLSRSKLSSMDEYHHAIRQIHIQRRKAGGR